MRLIPITFIGLLAAQLVMGAEADEPETRAPQQIVDSYMSRIVKGELEAVLDELAARLPIAVNPEQIASMKTHTKAMIPRFGKMLGYELAKEQSAGSVMHLVYVMKHEKHPVTWQFYFYKPEATWILDTFRCSDKLDVAF